MKNRQKQLPQYVFIASSPMAICARYEIGLRFGLLMEVKAKFDFDRIRITNPVW
jgi:hypothetical protein